MKKARSRGPSGRYQQGASLVELVIVLAIAAVVTTFSVALFARSTKSSFQRQNAARQFKNMLERARFDAVKRRALGAQFSTVKILSSTSYSYTLDLNQSGTIDSGETVTMDLSSLGVTVTSSTTNFPITVSFDQRGQTSTVDASANPVTPIFYFCNGPCSASTSTDQNSNIIYVSPTGTVAMMKGGTTLPTFGNPSVTSVASNSYVNPSLAVWNAPPSTPPPSTPTPTPTPVVPTPTPTPLPTATPTPTPTPASCASGQYVSTGCQCNSPMWIRSNGKCR